MRTRHLQGATVASILTAAGCWFLAGGCVDSSSATPPTFDGSAAEYDANRSIPGFDATAADGGGTPPATDDGGEGIADAAPLLVDSAPTEILDAEPQALASGLAYPTNMVVGGGYLYWQSAATVPAPMVSQGATVGVLDTKTGVASTLTNASGWLIGAITVDSAAVYWADENGDVTRVAHGTTTQQVIGKGVAPYKLEISSDGQFIYWGDTIQGGSILKIPTTGFTTTATTVLSGLPIPQGTAVVNGTVYVCYQGPNSSGYSGSVGYIPPGADASVTLFPSQLDTSQMQTDGTHLFWMDIFDPGGILYSSYLDGGAFTTYAPAASGIYYANDGVSLYWPTPVADGGYTIGKTAIGDNAGVKVLHTFDYEVEGVAVDDTWVYWTDWTNQRLYRAPK